MTKEISEATGQEYGRAYWLVGRFMNHWALLENTVNKGVGKLLGTGPLETVVATANMHFQAKIHILTTLTHVQQGTTEWGKAALTDLGRIATISGQWRNIVAHVPFAPSSNGVEFFTIKAKRKLTFPKTRWSRTDFDNISDEIMTLTKRVDEIVRMLTKSENALAGFMEAASATPPALAVGNPFALVPPRPLASMTPTHKKSLGASEEPQKDW